MRYEYDITNSPDVIAAYEKGKRTFTVEVGENGLAYLKPVEKFAILDSKRLFFHLTDKEVNEINANHIMVLNKKIQTTREMEKLLIDYMIADITAAK